MREWPDLCAGSPDNVAAGASVTWTTPQTKTRLGIHGTVTLRSSLSVDTCQIYPTGSLILEAGASVVFRPVTFGADDPLHFAGGLLTEGKVFAQGPTKTPFVRVASEPLAGQTTLTLEATPVGWQAGDMLAVPDTRHLRMGTDTGANFVPQWEVVTIASIAGAAVTLGSPLQFDHRGARNLDGVLEALPHVANLARSIVIRSEAPDGVRAHCIASEHADWNVSGVLFQDLGRTLATSVAGEGTENQIGRYSTHFHHLQGPHGLPSDVPQFRHVGNVHRDSTKWPIAIHASHYGLVKENVVWGCDGSGIVTEAGNETENVIESNFVGKVQGGGGGRDGLGREGVGFYFRGGNNYVRKNVAVNCLTNGFDVDSAYGFKFYQTYLTSRADGTIGFPAGKGSHDVVQINPFTLPILEFRDNEVYGATESGLTYWWIGVWGGMPAITSTRSVLKNTRCWHVYNKGIFNYDAALVTIDGWWQRGQDRGYGIDGGDYLAYQWQLKNLDIEGVEGGVFPSTDSGGGVQTVDTARLRNRANVVMFTLYKSGGFATWIHPRTVTGTNVTLIAPPSGAYTPVAMSYRTSGILNLIAKDSISLNGQRYVYAEQAPDFIVPQTVGTAPAIIVLGSPDAGLTNAQNWAKHGIAIAGEISGDPVPPHPEPEPPMPSPDNTRGLTITDATDGVWTLGTTTQGGRKTLRNGVHMAGGGAVEYWWLGGVVYVRNDVNRWFRWTGNAWQMTTEPVAPAPPVETITVTVTTPSGVYRGPIPKVL